MPRLPLIATLLALAALGAIAFLLADEPAAPVARVRTEPRRAEPVGRGIEPATAEALAPTRTVRATIEPSANRAANGVHTGPSIAHHGGDGAREPMWLGARLLHEGRALAGFELTLVPDGKGRRQHVRTDEHGRFRRVLPFAGTWTLRAEGEGLSAHQAEWTVTVADGAPFDLGDLVVRPRVRVHGRALSADGSPLRGAVVRGTAANGEQPLPDLRTGEDGAFAWLDVPPGEVHLVASTDAELGRARLVVDDERASVAADLSLRARAAIRWTLRDDDGRPIADATVEPADPAFALDPSARADELGNVELESSVGARLRIRSGGCFPVVQTVDASADERRIVLLRRRELRGTVGAIGKGARIRIALPQGSALDSPCADVLQQEHRADDSGRFAIAGLVAGRYTIRAHGEGCAAPLREIALPADELLLLECVPGRVREVRVRDERSLPVPFARVHANGRTWRTDRDGEVAVAVPGEAPVELAIELAGHLPTSLRADEGVLAEVLLPRAARLDGRVLGYRGDPGYALRVLCWREKDGPQRKTELALDAEGRFDAKDLEPGTFVVAVERKDRTMRGGAPTDLALLADGIDTRATTRVAAVGGERTDLLLPLPELAEIRGRVVAGGKPVAGAVVFAVPHEQAPPAPFDRDPLGFDHTGAQLACPRTTTRADGSFAMLVGRPGTFDLRTRAPAQPFASEPVVVAVRSYGDRPQAVLDLPTGVVAGRFAVVGDGEPVRAWLLPPEAAAADPFRARGGAPIDARGRLSVAVAADGAFAFRAVPPGLYLLRFTRGDRVLRQRTLRVDGGLVDAAVLDAAPVAKPAQFALTAAPPKAAVVELLALLPECPNGAFAARLPATAQLALRGIPAGRYRLVVRTETGDVHSEEVVELRGDGTALRPALAKLR